MSILYLAHSGLRYLVLLAAAVALLVLAVGWARRSPYGRGARMVTASFAGALHLQLLLGVALVALGRWYTAVAGHLVLMLAAAAVATAASARARRSPDARRAYTLALGGTALALVLVVVGIAAIGRGPLESRAWTEVPAAPLPR